MIDIQKGVEGLSGILHKNIQNYKLLLLLFKPLMVVVCCCSHG